MIYQRDKTGFICLIAMLVLSGCSTVQYHEIEAREFRIISTDYLCRSPGRYSRF